MTTTSKEVQNLTALGTITTGDKLVGERVAGTTGLFTYAVDITLDTAPALGGDLNMAGYELTSAKLGSNLDMNAYGLTDARLASNLNVETYAVVDTNTNELFKFSPAASAVNEMTVFNAATGSGPNIAASGDDSNIDINLSSKNTGKVVLNSANTSTAIRFNTGTANQHTTDLSFADTSATRTITIPDYDGTAMLMSSAGSAGQIIRSAAGSVNAWSTATFADTYGASEILYSNGANTVQGLTTAANGVLVTNGSSVPSIATDLPTAVTIGGAYVHRVGGTDVAVADGGTGQSSYTNGQLLIGNTTGNTLAKGTLTAGDGINISNGAGSITLTKAIGPMCRAYRTTSTQTLSHGAWTKLQLNATAIDTESDFDTSTNYRYTPSVAGYYLFNLSGALTTFVDQTSVGVAIFKNGSLAFENVLQCSGTGNMFPQVTTVESMNGTTDYVEMYMYNGTGGNSDLQIGNSRTYFNIAYMGAS